MKTSVKQWSLNAMRVTIAAVSAIGSLASAWASQPAPVAMAVPLIGVSLNVPAQVPIGSNVNFTVTFDNTAPNGPGNTGYGPFIDLYFPVEGVDGDGAAIDDGIDFVSAAYLGAPVTATQLTFPGPGPTGCVNHPYAVAPVTGAALQVCGPTGDKLVVLQLPFGSFTPDQPAATVSVQATLSDLADLGAPLTLRARGGYQFGATPTNDWCCFPFDATLLSNADTNSLNWTPAAPMTPTLLTLTKTYTGPEDETATGPNFPRRYTITATWPNNQPIGNLTLTDFLPNNIAFSSVVSTAPAGATVVQTPTVGAAADAPNNDLVVTWPVTLTSGSASVTFEYFVPLSNAANSPVLNPTTGDDATSPDNAEATGGWDPLDSRDPVTPTSVSVGTIDHTLTDKSIAIQKSVTPGVVVPGSLLTYTLQFQVSDFFAFDSVVISDTFSDGQRWDNTFVPTLLINGNAYTLNTTAMNAANFTVDVSEIGNDPNPATDGSTTVTFRVSNEIVTRGQNGRMVGGCVNPVTGSATPNCAAYNDGATTGTLIFRTVVQDQFSDTYPSGDPSVDHGDVLNNAVTITGDVLNTATFALTGQSESDDSGAGVVIAFGVLNKSVYAVNASTTFTTPVRVRPGDTVTYRLTYSLPTSDYEDLIITDYLPLPVFAASEVTTFDDTVSATPPPAGTWKFGPTETFRPLGGNGVGCPIPGNGDGTPCLTIDTDSNSLAFSYGDFDDPTNTNTNLDLLFTVTVSNLPFADGLFLTNQARAFEGTTNSGSQTRDGIVQIQLTQPVLSTSKAIVATSNPSAIFVPAPPAPVIFNAPGTAGPRWAGLLNSTNALTTTGGVTTSLINSDVMNVDAGDLVTFAILIYNTGTSTKGAFDVTISDTLPSGYLIPTGGINLRVSHGDPASVLSYTRPDDSPAAETDLFNGGLKISDLGPNQGACQAHDATNGLNFIVLTYDLQLDPTVTPNNAIVNTAILSRYAGEEGGPNHLPIPKTDTASATPVAGLVKSLVGTNQPHTAGSNVAIGEIITYSVTLTIPEGMMNNVVVTDTLDLGLAFVGMGSITASPGVTTSVPGGFAAVAAGATVSAVGALPDGGGRRAVLDFGTLTNSDTDNAITETVTLNYTAVVINGGSNDRGDTRNNAVTLTHQFGTLTSAAPDVTIVEPALALTKQVAPATNVDAGDIVTFTLRVTNTAPSNTEAFNIVLTDVVPSGLTYVPGSFANTGGVVPVSLTEAGGVLTATWSSLALNQNSTLQFAATLSNTVAPGQVINNIANGQWTSLPGPVAAPQSSFNTLSAERTGHTGDVGGNENDYRTNASASVTVRSMSATKSLVSTSEAHTSGSNVAIGEIVRYRLAVQIPEGTAANVQVEDQLPNGLTYRDDGTATVAFVTNDAGLTSTGVGSVPALSGAGLAVTGNSSVVTPTFGLPDANVGADNSTVTDNDTYTTGANPFFKLGNLVNADSDSDAEFVVIEFNVLVDNTALGDNDRGEARNNNFRVFVNGVQSGSTSANVTVTIVEPAVTLNKTVSPLNADAGDPVTFSIAYTNAAPSNATAFDVVLTDVVPSGVTYVNGTLAASGANVPDTLVESGGVITATWAQLPVGGAGTLTFNAIVGSGVLPGQLITNTATAEWTSLPITGTASNPTGSVTPGGSGASNGERNGNGSGKNTYRTSDPATVTVDSGVFLKTLASTSAAHTSGSNVTIGETASYTLTVILPEAVIPSVVVTDVLPSGLQFITATVDTTGFSAVLPAPAITGGAGNGDDVVLDFGSVTVPDDNDLTNNTFRVLVTARVLDVPGNVGVNPPGQTTLVNSAILRLGSVVQTSNPVTTTVVEPRLVIVKDITPAQAAANDVVTVTLSVTNTGTSTAFEVVVDDPLSNVQLINPVEISTASGFTFSTVPSGTNTIVRYTGGDLAVGGNAQFVFTAQLANGVTAGQVIPNVASVTQATTLPGPDVNERDEPDVNGSDTVTVIAPDLTLVKDDGLTTVSPGQTVAYTLTVSNVGGRAASGVTVTDTVPANTVFNPGASSAGWSCAPDNNPGSVCTLSLGALNAGANTSVTFALTVNDPVPAGVTQIVNTASVADDGTRGADPTPGNNSDGDTDTLNAAPDLQIVKTDGGVSTVPGGVVTYTLTYTNAGNQHATGVTLTETVPANSTFTGSGWSCAPNNSAGSACTLNVGALTVGASGSVEFGVTVDNPLAAGVTQLSNTASIADDGSNGTDPTPGNNTSTDTTPITAAPDLQIVKTDGGVSTAPGGVVTYTLTYTNVGNQTATGVTLTETVPANTTFTGSGWACVPNANAGSLCTQTVGALSGGASGAASFAVTVDNPLPAGVDVISNTASIADDGSNGSDPTPGDNTSTDTTPVNAAPDLQITKTDGGVSTLPSGVVTYTLTYTNAGNQAATGVTLTETVPADTTFTGSGWTCAPNANAGSTCTLSVGTLNAGASGAATFVVTVNASVPLGVTQIVNTASIRDDGSNGADPTPGDNTSTDTTPLNSSGIVLTKDVTPGTAVNGQPITYTLRFTNTGALTLDPVTLTDTLPVNFNYLTGTASVTPDVISGTQLVWNNLGPLTSGQSRTLTFAVTPTVGALGTFINTALVTGLAPTGPVTDTDDAPIVLADPSVIVDKQLLAMDTDPLAPNYITFTIRITNTGVSPLDVVPLLDAYDPAYLSFVAATPVTDDNVDDGNVRWSDLTASGPGGFGVDLAPGQTFVVTTTFRIVQDIVNTVNTATVSGARDTFGNPVSDVNDSAPVNNVPTSVELLYFRVGGVSNGAVTLEWATGAEVDNYGFKLYRAASNDFAQATEVTFVPASGSGVTGATYAYTESPGTGNWWYWLVDVDTQGRQTRHAPVYTGISTDALPVKIFLPIITR